MDGNSAYYIMVPILMPVALKLGIDPIHLCTIMVMNIAIGLITPPVGANLYVACGIANMSMKDLCVKVVPFAIASIIALMFVTYIPQISLFLPSFLN